MAARRWRYYTTAAGRQPVRDFLDGLDVADRAAIVEEMAAIRRDGLAVARHLRGDIYEVRVFGLRQAYRVLSAPEGRCGQVLLALEGFSKKTQKTPAAVLAVAEQRLSDWRERGRRP